MPNWNLRNFERTLLASQGTGTKFTIKFTNDAHQEGSVSQQYQYVCERNHYQREGQTPEIIPGTRKSAEQFVFPSSQDRHNSAQRSSGAIVYLQ